MSIPDILGRWTDQNNRLRRERKAKHYGDFLEYSEQDLCIKLFNKGQTTTGCRIDLFGHHFLRNRNCGATYKLAAMYSLRLQHSHL